MKRNQLSIFQKQVSHSARLKDAVFGNILAQNADARHTACFATKAIAAAATIMAVAGLFAAYVPKVYAETTTATQTTQATDDQAQRIQMQATIDSLQKTIAELNAKVQARQAAAPVQKMTLPQIAAEVQRIAKEKEILAQKVQVYVAAHPAPATAAQTSTATTADANTKIAAIKKEINELTEKLMAQKAGSETAATAKEATTETAEKTEQPAETPAKIAEQPAEKPAEAPAETAKTEQTTPPEGTPEITITPEGDVVADGEKQGITVTTQNPKKGLFQSIGDYIASLFKF